MKLAIIAGGKGTRLGINNVPKPMVTIAGKPILEHQIELAKRYGLNDIYLLTGHLSDVIADHFGDGSQFGVHITHIAEDSPLGTAGAIKMLEGKFKDRFMVFYGDTIMDIDLSAFIEFDRSSESIATIIVHPNDHPYDSDLIEISGNGDVTSFFPAPHRTNLYYRNTVNGALYILSPGIFPYIPRGGPSDFGKDIFPLLLRSGQTIKAYKTSEYLKDIGTPDRLTETEKDLLGGKVRKLNRANKRKAIFLDRDGVLNRDLDNVRTTEDFELIPGVGQAVKMINSSEYLAIVITNQPVIAKGFCTEDELREIHNKMETLLGTDRAFIDGLYYCPHHPQKGFDGEVSRLKIECDCRKPKPGLIHKAALDHNIDLSGSYLIGDRYADIQAGTSAGLKTILLRTGWAGNDRNKYTVKPDNIFSTLSEAVAHILGPLEEEE